MSAFLRSMSVSRWAAHSHNDFPGHNQSAAYAEIRRRAAWSGYMTSSVRELQKLTRDPGGTSGADYNAEGR